MTSPTSSGGVAPGSSEALLQPHQGRIDGQHYVPSTADEVSWGTLPNRDTAAMLTLMSGETVTIDSVSHEGLLEDQGRDPVGYLAEFGVPAKAVLDDARDIAASLIIHDFDDGPHIVTGPIAVDGVVPGDLLKVEVLTLALRATYGFISNRHGLGALPGEFPEQTQRHADAAPHCPHRYGSVCRFTTVEERHGEPHGILPYADGLAAEFPLNPFVGLMGVAPDTSETINSVPPGNHGGNLDINVLGTRSTLYLPVQVPGALFYAGDPHYAQGNGEVALTAFEAPLRATFRLSVLSGAQAKTAVGLLCHPFAETTTHWVPVGLDVDLNEAMRRAVRAAIDFLSGVVGMGRAEALAYLSAAANFEVSQVVDAVKGVHCLIRKADFPGYSPPADRLS